MNCSTAALLVSSCHRLLLPRVQDLLSHQCSHHLTEQPKASLACQRLTSRATSVTAVTAPEEWEATACRPVFHLSSGASGAKITHLGAVEALEGQAVQEVARVQQPCHRAYLPASLLPAASGNPQPDIPWTSC